MDPVVSSESKRPVAAFLPWRKRMDGEKEFFFQLRDEHAPVHPNIYSLFGGGLEKGESAHEGFLREVKEELDYAPKNAVFFTIIETAAGLFSLFIEEVGSDFESVVDVREGKGAAFMTFTEAANSGNISPVALVAVEGVLRHLAGR